ncbi:nucleotidyltransferase domain-containing protein [Methanobacterium congolense]|uniref:protein adenylyltransferase n=1 Tax=Methanobacterium congolense TaxID=118062 RepID=A0A1D3L156_9EURY|nr:nucleotidyltransferase domain-containing protein [Methanobacterium congolense]SCG85404.1 putative protein [Methanobacterium congolense]
MGRNGIEEIKEFQKRVNEEFNPEVFILFGSRARGDYLKESDYDFIIVSRKFEGIHFLERIYRVLELWDYDWDVDILPYTPEEFSVKKDQIGIVNEAVKQGIVLEESI